jgi:hypothetical protein
MMRVTEAAPHSCIGGDELFAFQVLFEGVGFPGCSETLSCGCEAVTTLLGRILIGVLAVEHSQRGAAAFGEPDKAPHGRHPGHVQSGLLPAQGRARGLQSQPGLWPEPRAIQSGAARSLPRHPGDDLIS